ncbi:MAG: SPOR domain-containing protein [Succinivibrio sp.]|nr:SPOR domain-containing protein [Succinivibrio sp.]
MQANVRNRIVGLLAVVALGLIMVPTMMSPQLNEQKRGARESIAVNPDGAASLHEEQGGAVVEHDYSDLLEPVDDRPGASGVAPDYVPAEFRAENREVTAALDRALQEELGPIDETPAGSEKLVSSRAPAARADAAAVAKAPEKKAEPPKSAQAKKPEKKEAAKPAAKAAASASGSYVLQVGVFSQQANASSVVAKLKKAGITAHTEQVVLNGQNMFKVLTGTYKSREAAQKAADKVQSAVSTAPRILPAGK